MGTPCSMTLKCAAATVVAWRPSQPTVSGARTSISTLRCVGADADGAAAFVDEAGDFVLHEDAEVWVAGGLLGEEAEEVPLRDEGDEFCGGGQVREVDERERLLASHDAEGFDSLVWEGEEGVEEAEFFEDFERGGVHGVAAEIAVEVFVFFEDGDVDARAGELEAKHHAGGASAYDAACCLEWGIHCEFNVSHWIRGDRGWWAIGRRGLR